MKNIDWKNIWINVRLLLIFAAVIFLYAFSSQRNGARKIKPPVVEFVNANDLFITHETVNKLLIENNANPQSIAKDKLDLNKLEQTINNHDMVQESEVFVSIDGVLKAVVTQKIPIARIFDESGSFYIDSEGNRMPLSAVRTARVPIVLGAIDHVKQENLHELLLLIQKDDFLKKNITGIEILHGGSLKMTNRNYDYVIEFGKTVSVERKFDNYKAFLQKAIQDTIIEQYKVINLKFTQQVVCTK